MTKRDRETLEHLLVDLLDFWWRHDYQNVVFEWQIDNTLWTDLLASPKRKKARA